MSDQIRIPLTADQKRLIAEAAGLNALEMTAWARSVLVRAATEQKALQKTTEGETTTAAPGGRGDLPGREDR